MSFLDYKPYTYGYQSSVDNRLSAPTDISIHPGYTSVSANWNKVNGADQYLVTIIGDGDPITQYTNTNNIYISSGLESGSMYNMYIEPISNGITGPEGKKFFSTMIDTLATTSEAQDVSPPQSPADICGDCTNNNACIYCTGKPFCVHGKCQICDPSNPINSDSECYQYKYICVDNGTEAQCQKCNTMGDKATSLCQLGYGPDFYCNMDSGICENTPLPSPPASNTPPTSPETPQKPINWGLIIGLTIGIFVAILIIALTLYFMTRKSHKNAPTAWPMEIL